MSEFRPLIIIPTYNTGRKLLLETVHAALDTELDLLLVVDGTTDGSADRIESSFNSYERLKVIRKKENTGKGDSVRIAASFALKKQFTHALIMDADGQHPASSIHPMLDQARKQPDAIIMGQPIFDSEAPLARVYGRKLTEFWTDIETLWCGLGDTLFGMRVYPLQTLMLAFMQTSFARGFDFDPEIAVRMTWLGCRPVPHQVSVRYLPAEAGGVSHFHYLRDNCKLTLLHFRLVPEFILVRLFSFIRRKRLWQS